MEQWHFNPRSPCGERQTVTDTSTYTQPFQSTLPVRGATALKKNRFLLYPDFNPRSPCGERLRGNYHLKHITDISIHAPRAGSDLLLYYISMYQKKNFNPRSPCGERPFVSKNNIISAIFQSTLPVRGATPHKRRIITNTTFQSTLPVRGATVERALVHEDCRNFNPRSPCGERPGFDIQDA